MAGVLAVGLLVVAPLAQARTAATLSLHVTFFANSTIALTLPDGTPVGTSSGTPTVIPAGYYTIVLSGPGGCTVLPHFDLKGPGESIHDNMTEGEVANETLNAFLAPNSTYTWSNYDATPQVVFTFKTGSDVQGTAPTAPVGGIVASNHGTASSQDVIGSARIPFRGTLTGAVSAAGALSLAFKGKSVTHLTPGRYRITVVDKSTTNGFMVESSTHKVTSITGTKYMGKHTGSMRLTAGRWIFTPLPGKSAYTITVK